MTSLEKELKKTVLNNFIDKDRFRSNEQLSANLILNRSEQSNFYRVLQNELKSCTTFTFAVAFITNGGFTDFLTILKDLRARGIKGRILTSTYLYFNKPEVFRAMSNVPNIEVRIYEEKNDNTNQQIPFHAKGYLFKHPGYESVLVGSSNLTATALIKNYEWNLRVNSLDNAEITHQITYQINQEWEKAKPFSQFWLEKYKNEYKKYHSVENFQLATHVAEDDKLPIPNKMQRPALDQLTSLRQSGKNKALIISATGTGKTYLGAFDVRNFKPKRFLYLIQNREVLLHSLHSFERVLGGTPKDYGIYTGNDKTGKNAKYLFATVQSVERNLSQFKPKEFDYILFDEAHHLGAKEEQKIFKYFKPKFCLGMTATPERTDDFNVYKLFDYNIAYEIRLKQALENDMLCPFHYYGVSDYEYHGQMIDDSSTLQYLVNDERVDYIIRQTKYYGYSGEVLHGLIFCSRDQEAEILAKKLTLKGFPSDHLSGKDSTAKRRKTIKKLEKGEIKYITSVDVFNEGIDIPCINQIVLLRSTKSPIVFVQQLGRGLRKAHDKEYLSVIDFVGNYNNNYLIPIALTGDKSHNKDHLRDQMELEPISGLSVINFTIVAKERIFHSIKHNNLLLKRKLYEEYQMTKKKLGHIPLMQELQRDSIDCEAIAEKYKNYYAFLKEMGETKYKINDFEEKVLSFVTVNLANGKRRHELLLLNALSKQSKISDNDYFKILRKHNCQVDESTLNSVNSVLNLNFFDTKAKPNKESYGNHSLIHHKDEKYSFSGVLLNALKNKDFRLLFRDAVKTGLVKAKNYQKDTSFTLNKRYTRLDVNRILNWEKFVPPTNIGGYKFDEDNKNCAIFITYKKSEDLSTLNYPDQFINRSLINMASKYPRNLKSKDIQEFRRSDFKFYLFLKKSDDEGSSFIYLGTCKPDSSTFKQRYMTRYNKKRQAKKVPIVTMNLKLDTPVELDEYYMFTSL